MEENEEEIPEGGRLRLRGNLDNNSPNEEEFNPEERRGNIPQMITSTQQSTSYRTSSNVIDRRRIQHVRIKFEGKLNFYFSRGKKQFFLERKIIFFKNKTDLILVLLILIGI
ncbi:hypothetical protein ACQ4LE_010818 [Meloidogyne hapla]